MSTITLLSTPPSRADPANFRARADTHHAELPVFVVEANALAAGANLDAANASASAASASISQSSAIASANAAQLSTGVTKWVSGTSYTDGQVTWAPSNYQSYRRKGAGAGTTDPASDAANWALLPMVPIWVIKTANYTAVNGESVMANTTASAFSITLPASPSVNNRVLISDYAGTFWTNNLTLVRNGSKIQGLDEDYICNISHETRYLTFIDATQGWRVT